MCLLIKNVLKPCRGMKCFLFSEPAMKNTICYQTVEKAISAGFKTQTLQAHFQALSGKGLRSFKQKLTTAHPKCSKHHKKLLEFCLLLEVASLKHKPPYRTA